MLSTAHIILSLFSTVPLIYTIDLSEQKTRLKSSLESGKIPQNLIPYLNLTAVEEQKSKSNGSLDFIIRDDDVAEDDVASGPPVLDINEMYYDGNKTVVKISEEATYQLIQKWVDQAASGFMSAMMSSKIHDKRLTNHDRKRHNNCTKAATSIEEHAKCVVHILNRLDDQRRKSRRFRKLKFRRTRFRRDVLAEPEFVVHHKAKYELKEKADVISPFSMIAKQLTNMVRERKKKEKEPKKKWQNVISEIKDEVERIKRKKKSRDDLRQKFSKYSRVMKSLGIDPKEAFKKMGLESFGDEVSAANETGKMTENERMLKKPLMMIRDGVKLGMMLAGKNVSNFDERKIALISPQFMSVSPDEHANDTNDEQKQEMEAYRKHFSNEKGQPMYFTKENVTEMYGDYEASKIDSMERLHKSMSAQQMLEMNTTGYAIMSNEQMSQLYGPGSPYNDSHAYENYRKLRRDEIPYILEHNIHRLAQETNAFKIARRKDIILSPVLFTWITLLPSTASQPIVLSPLVFSPLILSPSALGPLILSPWIFTPLILSPRVLAPIILSPTIFSPLILSPLALSPLILSPAVAVPLILSPFVLTPFILTPLVMVPVILNPFCLSPFIGTPNTLSPLILSPFVLSPLILSPPYVNAFVLSPYFLSPILLSDGFLFTAVLSPAILS
ncbi:unnamed protein product [Caenorhabditis sp. 36 PRJEB53466]|nr:unnamed protein product [Caenorhabditis sp. 36 PRJEB53466]